MCGAGMMWVMTHIESSEFIPSTTPFLAPLPLSGCPSSAPPS